ncbi:hypothetical protein SJA_C1-17430 [Sphingobium indicum UT26S]|uniref:Uncharacterized protein n=1 Tax=Sphingobium indicum (strain DSM 16413 / CCM 7287 / MTCC 6362 / UT26 / NBRC 101211 / UT26S) TaxID=452662 RepID=D4Z1U5_SPHIU|nr:hypothetical protein SJA_C1-17430 [Sphingobium indicum UT26S]
MEARPGYFSFQGLSIIRRDVPKRMNAARHGLPRTSKIPSADHLKPSSIEPYQTRPAARWGWTWYRRMPCFGSGMFILLFGRL